MEGLTEFARMADGSIEYYLGQEDLDRGFAMLWRPSGEPKKLLISDKSRIGQVLVLLKP